MEMPLVICISLFPPPFSFNVQLQNRFLFDSDGGFYPIPAELWKVFAKSCIPRRLLCFTYLLIVPTTCFVAEGGAL